MSKVKKVFLILIIAILLEIILICFAYKQNGNTINIKNYNPKMPITIIADVISNELFVLQDNKIIKTYQISGGKPSTPSPIGTWKIISKGTWGEGFGGHWMGFNVPWGKYGIHGTIYPNYIGSNSSHGCLRMRNNEVAELYKITKHGTYVIIYGGPYGNFGHYLRPIKPGMTGSDIFEVQQLLKEKGYFKGKPNGIYSEWMKSIIHKFQKDNNIPVSDVIDNSFYKKLGVKLFN